MSQLTPDQLAHVEQWAADGANLNQVQDRLKTEFGISLTYLDARLLMVDVGVRLQEKPREPEKVAASAEAPPPGDESFADSTDSAPVNGVILPPIMSPFLALSSAVKSPSAMDKPPHGPSIKWVVSLLPVPHKATSLQGKTFPISSSNSICSCKEPVSNR